MSQSPSARPNLVVYLGPETTSYTTVGSGSGLSIANPAKPIDDEDTTATPKEKIAHVTEYYDQDKHQWKQRKVGKPRVDKKQKTKTRRYVFKCVQRESQGNSPARPSVEVYGTYICAVFKDITREDRGPSFRENAPIDYDEMKLLWHRKGDLETRLRRETQVAFPNHNLIFEIDAAIDLIHEIFSDVHSQIEALEEGEITFDLLWTCFPPLSLVTGQDALGQRRLHRVRETGYEVLFRGERVFRLITDYISSDGKKTGFVKDTTLHIREFRGAKRMLDLSHHCFCIRPNFKQERDALIDRGGKWLRLRGRHVQEYRGHAVNGEDHCSGKFNVGVKFPVGHAVNGEDHCSGKFNSHGRVVLDPVTFEQVRPNNCLIPDIVQTLYEFTDEDKLLMDPLLYGFSLGDKIWGAFAVPSLMDVLWDSNIIDNLVIPGDQKDFIRILVETHIDSGFDDIVRDKGKGLVGLLSGPPGVGKTLTAEAVAEIAHKPLYTVSSGELGDSPTHVQKALDQIMELAEAWNAVVLLDEADVFLIKRDNMNLTRNAITTIFLRQLEYYQGILLLTTNRQSSFDPAFKSRIHFSIDYPELDLDARRTIWGMFLRRTSESKEVVVDIGDDELVELAKLQLNGRQIKNAVKIVHTTALRNDVPITSASIHRALKFTVS